MTGKIIKGIAGFYYVLCEDECLYECKAKGGFRKDGVKPLVGDNVVVRVLDEAKCLGNIEEILERKNQLIRPAVANVDQALVILGLVAGRFSDCHDDGEEFKKNLTDSLHKLDDLAEHYQVRLGFEIMNRFESDYLTTIAEGVEYLKKEKFQKLLLHIDTVHMNIEEAHIGDAIRAGKGYIGHVHVADNDRWYPGHAHYDFQETIQALKEIGYDGALALETNCEPDTRTCARKSLEYLKRILGE